MSSTTIDRLELEIQSNSSKAISGIDALSSSLSRLRNSIKSGLGLNSVVTQLNSLNNGLKEINGQSISNIDRLATSLSKLSSLGNLKISASIGNQLKNLGTAITSLNSVNFASIDKLKNGLEPLSNLGKAGGLKNTITQLQKFPEVAKTFENLNIDKLAQDFKKLGDSLKPLSEQLSSVSNSFSKLPSNISKTADATKKLNDKTKDKKPFSYMELWAKAKIGYTVAKKTFDFLGGLIKSSSEYIENLNLFSVAMGEYANEAKRFAINAGELLGIDPSEFIRNQGIFMTITKGFGVASDRAYIMSKNLTQLGYDLSSFFNISVPDAMQKLTSGISGELEPLRRLGYDLSQARLKAEALSLGINKVITEMTQAEKAQLRYHAILTQVTDAQQDMARTLHEPANQMRLFSAQVNQLKRSLGNLLLPVFQSILPYAIAIVKIIKLIVDTIGGLFGIKFPDFAPSLKKANASMGGFASGADDAQKNLGNAAKKAKEIKNAVLGIDELNIISDDTKEALNGGGKGLQPISFGGGFDFPLPEYEFFDNAIKTRIDEIVQGMKEWLGLTEPINNWADFFNTRLGRITAAVLAVKAALLGWKISSLFFGSLDNAETRLAKLAALKITIGAILSIVGITVAREANLDILKNGYDAENVTSLTVGSAATLGGGYLIGKTLAKPLAKTKLAKPLLKSGLSVGKVGARIGLAGAGALLSGFGAYDSIVDMNKNGVTLENGIQSVLSLGSLGASVGSLFGPLGTAIGAAIGGGAGAINIALRTVLNNDQNKQTAVEAGTKLGMIVNDNLKANFKFEPQVNYHWVEVIEDGVAKLKLVWEGTNNEFGENWDRTQQNIENAGVRTGRVLRQEWDSNIGSWKNTWYTTEEYIKKGNEDTTAKVTKDWKDASWQVQKQIRINNEEYENATVSSTTKQKEAFEKLTKEWTKSSEEITQWFQGMWKNTGNFFGGLWDGVKEKFKGFNDWLTKTFGGSSDTVKNSWESTSTSLEDSFGRFVGRAKESGESLIPYIKDELPNKIKESANWGTEVGDYMWTNINDGLLNSMNNNQTWAVGIGEKTVNALRNEFDINSPSRLMHDQVGVHLGDGIKQGMEESLNDINSTVFVKVLKSLTDEAKKTPIQLETKFKKVDWKETLESFGEPEPISVGVKLHKHEWTTIKDWIGRIDILKQLIQLSKYNWTTVKEWVGYIPVLFQNIQLQKHSWSTVKDWIGYLPTINQGISLIKHGWSSVPDFVGSHVVGVGISLYKAGWSDIGQFVGTSVTVDVHLRPRGGGLRSYLGGFSQGGYIDSNGVHAFAKGGFMKNGKVSSWNSIPMYANGTTNAGLHGSLFVAGEAGAEMVGHINGQTEVLNQSQIKLAMKSAIISGMAQFTGYWRAINSQLAECSNAIIRAVLINANAVNNLSLAGVGYDPSLAEIAYDEVQNTNSQAYADNTMYTTLQDFYKEHLEPMLKSIATDTKRQADKDDRTLVQIGNRTVTDAVTTQRKANGYNFTE